MTALLEAPPFELLDGADVPHDEDDRPCHLRNQARGRRGVGLCGAVVPESEWRPPHWPCNRLCPLCVEIAGPERMAQTDAALRGERGDT